MSAPEALDHDVVGVGFGPSNLALAVAVEERRPPLRACFLEKRLSFAWHPGMLIEGATVQVSFLKDLVTLRNPASDFSFVAYLHACGRLAEFVNHKTLFPLRAEFDAYFAWAAARLAHTVAYGREVTDVRPVVENGVVVAFHVTAVTATKRVEVHRARAVVVAAGLVPSLPPEVVLSERIWHNATLLNRLDVIDRLDLVGSAPRPRRFVVVGAGQSAAETTEYLCSRYPDAEVSAVLGSRFGYAPADDSPFTNRIFDPASVDLWYSAPDEVKEQLDRQHRNTNYSVVDGPLIETLYRRAYVGRVSGRERLRVLHASRVADVVEGPSGVAVTVQFLPDGSLTSICADVVVYATGYRPVDPLAVLGRAGRICRVDGQGRLRIGRDYRLELALPATAALYATGATEHSHGPSSTLLSNVSVRSGEILASICAPRLGDWCRTGHVECSSEV